MERVVEYSFSLNIGVLKLIGLYPSDTYRNFHKVYSCVLYILAMMPASIFGILHYVFTENITDFSYNDFITVGLIFYAVKFLPFVTNGNDIKNCIHYFDHSYYTATTNKHESIIGDCVNTCRRNSQVFFIGCIVGLTGFVGQLIWEDNLQLPLNVWLPKYVQETKGLYFTFYCLLLWGAAYSVLACSTIDPLIGGLSHHATAQVQVLKDTLHILYLHDDKIFWFTNIESKPIYKEIKECAIRYQLILNFVESYEQCFSPVVFTQFMSSGIVIGLLCFQISKVLTMDVHFLIMINYLGVLFFQIFFYCYYGTMLIEESSTLSGAIYLSQWYEFDIQSKKALIILMERSKKSMTVRAGKLFDLSVGTFTMILKRAYSLLAVLKNY